MKHGTVVQRHTRDCPRNEDGTFARHRCKGSWRWVLEYGHDSSGGRLQTSKSGYATRAAAQTALQDAVRIFKADVIVHSMTVEEYLTSWLAGKHALKPKTVELYTGLTRNYLAPHLGQVRLLELRAHHLEAMYGGLKIGRKGRSLSPTTIRRIHGVLRSALNSAVRRRLLSFNPAEHIELAPETPRRPRPWTAKQAQTFLASIESDRLPLPPPSRHRSSARGSDRPAVGRRRPRLPRPLRGATDHGGQRSPGCRHSQNQARRPTGARGLRNRGLAVPPPRRSAARALRLGPRVGRRRLGLHSRRRVTPAAWLRDPALREARAGRRPPAASASRPAPHQRKPCAAGRSRPQGRVRASGPLPAGRHRGSVHPRAPRPWSGRGRPYRGGPVAGVRSRLRGRFRDRS